MNEDIHEAGGDSLLVLLPGSEITPEGIRCLCRISGFDHFTIESRLKIKLPYTLCAVRSKEIRGADGDRLESLKINFLAVTKPFLSLPFKPFTVTSCSFENRCARFLNTRNEPVEIYKTENVLLIQGCYKTTDEKLSRMPGDAIEMELHRKPVTSVGFNDIKTFQFIMLYQVMDPGPLVFIDRFMNYSFLKSEKKLTVPDNFNAIREKLETTFSRKADPAMLEHRYLLQEVRNLGKQKPKRFKRKSSKDVVTTEISNEEAVNRMSRLLFFQWCKKNGWVERVMPGV